VNRSAVQVATSQETPSESIPAGSQVSLQETLAESERRARDILEALPAAIYTTDREGRITFYNRAAAELWGMRPTLRTDRWCGSWKLYNADGSSLAHDDCPMARALKEGHPVRGVEAVAERPDGSRVAFIPFPTPLYDKAGRMSGAVNMLVDISERKEAETRLTAMLDELNHRVKNMLATVQSLARHTIRKADGGSGAYEIFESRLFALSRAHDHLTSRSWRSGDLAAIVRGVCAAHRDARIRIEGSDVELSPRVSLALAMVVCELATNAARHGSLSASQGRVSFVWRVESGVLRMEWIESDGPEVAPPARPGFGMRLIERTITQDLKGRVATDFTPTGLACRMDIPTSVLA
jgi:PAS domain S-box-containing protein